MNVVRQLVLVAGIVLLAATCSGAVIGLGFDATAGGGLTEPFVGAGTFSFTVDPGDGISPLTAFGTYGFSFAFGGITFSDADLTTPVGEILVILGTSGSDRTLHFSNVNGFGNGCCSGSIDFLNGNGYKLSFEPPGYGGNLDLYFLDVGVRQIYFGNYGTVPEPATAGMLLAGGAALLLLRRRAKC
ncbi:MAG: PEP-CTERM sorting domain-containing protein [Acidobacteria bacterium]|nr:PEP-CTERM sorting domain-containing protein [Acidobacteriota bacterium]